MVLIPLEMSETYVKQFDRPLYEVYEEASGKVWRRIKELEALNHSLWAKIKELEIQIENDRLEKENVKLQISKYFGQ